MCGTFTLVAIGKKYELGIGVRASWQNVDYVYGLFSEKKRLARTRYRVYIEKGILGGKRPDLTGGGLLRSTGGRAVLKGLREITSNR